MIEWLADTLMMTGLLMTVILLVRRPVARWFGPAAAYALWALPMIRLVLPPLALPRGMLPQLSVAVEPVTAAAMPGAVAAGPALDAGARGMEPIVQGATIADPGFLAQVPWTALLLTVWLAGACVFLAWRTWNYRLMRREVLADAHFVARSGDVRIFESPAVAAPLAFGVFDKLVALPEGFLGSVDSESSDFAIAHELQHHAGNDLLAIMALQPLFALHWFNPLGWAAWRALRADQEAACDARVMAGCGREMRARYGRLIASFAAGTRLTLAAPMAGALAGEKPIIQRLKALGRAEVTPARKVAARSLFALAIVSVPFTATVTYAAMEAPETPEAPVAPAGPVAPAAPAAPAIRAIDPDASDWADGAAVPSPPRAPEAPAAPGAAPRGAAAPAPVPAPVPPVPPVPMRTISLRETILRDVDAAVAEGMRNVPEVRQRVSADGKVQVIRIVSKDGSGRPSIAQEMTLDSRCPADSDGNRGAAGRDPTAAFVRICTGAPKRTMEVAMQAIASARATVALNRALAADVRNEIISQLDAEMARTRAERDRIRTGAASSED